MAVIEARGVTHRYGKVAALRDVELTVPEGAIYGLIGPNGAGKTTLMQILMGLRRPTVGRVAVLGRRARALTYRDRVEIGYIAEGQRLPGHMTLRQLESYVAPLYDRRWDPALADTLRRRFRLNPDRKLRTLSRGESMKAALLCTLAPRPRLLVMDEPFAGMDVLVRDDLVRGLLESSGREGWTVLVCSHDVAELEPLIDWVGFLDAGRLILSEPMETVRSRFRWVEVTGPAAATLPPAQGDWLSAERAGNRLRFLSSSADTEDLDDAVVRWHAGAAQVDVRPASLRDVFLGLAHRRDDDGVAMARADRPAGNW
jgi:ABC-2 type transport system ATP-binding protein